MREGKREPTYPSLNEFDKKLCKPGKWTADEWCNYTMDKLGQILERVMAAEGVDITLDEWEWAAEGFEL